MPRHMLSSLGLAVIFALAPVASADVGEPVDDIERASLEVELLHDKAEALRAKANIAAASPGREATADARRDEVEKLTGYADRLDELAETLEEARDELTAAQTALVAAEDEALAKVNLIREEAARDGRDSVLGDLIEYVNFASGTQARPLNVAFCIITAGPQTTPYRDLVFAEIEAGMADLTTLQSTEVRKIDADGIKLIGALPAEAASDYLDVSDMVRDALVSAAVQTDQPSRMKAEVYPGDFAGDACGTSG